MTTRPPGLSPWPIRMLRHAVEAVMALVFLGFVLVITAQVVWRYGLNDSLFWSEEFVRFALYGMTMLSLALAADRQAHIVMDLWSAGAGPRMRRWLACLSALASAAFLLLLGGFGLQLVARSWETLAPVTELPMGWIYLATPAGCLLALVFTLDALWRGREAP